MNIFEIPTSNSNQSQVLSLGGTRYTLTTRWNDQANDGAGYWVLDIGDSVGNLILPGIPLVTGVNLLAQYDYLNIAGGGALVVQSDNDPNLIPDSITLGSVGHLYFVTK